ncbi:phosphohistidine phosphatase SixA [Salidesulfovibrio onnuriiensis]|uniref:phosphohistidine phosphatase SixA n=1 Tax=Salidesulfovibrio onnuriiensis TaxID=2583823 RepID=UPI0011C777F0|nr:phosphohistidine phosphatase SixA [Salidesulfovibrio onnuriiensis]
MHIYLMQHGACLPKELDPQQPLSPVGREQIEKSAAILKNLGLRFGVILASPKTRSMETAQIVAKAVGYPAKNIVCSDAIKPMADAKKTTDLILQYEDAESVFIAGHLPSLNNLASYLLLQDVPPTLHFGIENGGIMRISLEAQHRRGALDWLLPPRFLNLMR